MKFLKTFFFIIISLISKMNAILDGRVTPIYLDNRYTFTNGEWAYGTVFFNGGFDVPAGGTVYLGLDDGAVTNSISLNNGTLNINKNLSLRGRGYFAPPGFLQTKAGATAVFIYYESILQPLFDGTGSVFMSGPYVFQALTTSSRFDQIGCTLDLSQAQNSLGIVGGTIFWRSVITGVNNPPSIYFYDIDGFFGSATINSRIFFSGRSFLKTTSGSTFSTLTVIANGKLTIVSGSSITLNQIAIPNSARLEIKNSTLDFISTSTGQINIILPTINRGTIAFEGNCIIKSSTNNNLWLDDKVTLEFFSGSQLSLPSATSFSILPLAA